MFTSYRTRAKILCEFWRVLLLKTGSPPNIHQNPEQARFLGCARSHNVVCALARVVYGSVCTHHLRLGMCELTFPRSLGHTRKALWVMYVLRVIYLCTQDCVSFTTEHNLTFCPLFERFFSAQQVHPQVPTKTLNKRFLGSAHSHNVACALAVDVLCTARSLGTANVRPGLCTVSRV